MNKEEQGEKKKNYKKRKKAGRKKRKINLIDSHSRSTSIINLITGKLNPPYPALSSS